MLKPLIPILAITFIDVLGFTILVPILPFYAEHFGASPLVVGLLVSNVAFFALVMSPVWGRASDRLGRKKVLLITQSAVTVGYILLGVGGSLAMLFVARSVEGIGAGNLGVTQSYVSDLTQPKDRARAFGLLGAAFGSGFIFGPAIGATLVHFGYAVPFAAAAAFQVLTIGLTLWLLPESHKPVAKPPALAEIAASLRDRRVGNLLVQQLFFALSFTMWVTVFSLYLERVLRFGPNQTSWLFMTSGVIGVVMQLAFIGRLVDRFGERMVAAAGLSCAVCAYAFVIAVKTLPEFCVVLVLWSLSGPLVRPALGAQLSRAAPADQRGTILGVSDSLNNLSFVISPIVSTLVLTRDVRLVGILPALLATAALIVGLRGSKHAEESTAAA